MKSLLFAATNSQYLTRTFAVGNQKTWTFSTWIKRNVVGPYNHIFFTGSSYTEFGYLGIYINGDSKIIITTGAYGMKVTTPTFSDTAGWYHLLVAFDTTQIVADDRVKMWVDGIQITAFDSGIPPALNTNYAINSAALHYLGRDFAGNYCDMYMADTYFIDGQALTPSSFINGTGHGICNVIAYTGTFGATGFWETYENAASVTTLGYDDAGGAAGAHAGTKDWTLNNMTTANSSSLAPLLAPPLPPPPPPPPPPSSELQNIESLAYAISEETVNGPEYAFYGGIVTEWASAQAGGAIPGVSWIGQDFGVGRAITRITIEQSSAAKAINSVIVQWSDDKVTWSSVGTYAITKDTGLNVMDFALAGYRRYWRLLANASTGGDYWQVRRIRMYAPANTVPLPEAKFQIYRDINFPLTANVLTIVPFDAQWYDTNAEYNRTLFRHEPKRKGFYTYEAHIMIRGTSIGKVHVQVTKNGAPFVLPEWAGSEGLFGYVITVPLIPSDYVDVRVKVESGTNIVIDGHRSWFVGHFIGI